MSEGLWIALAVIAVLVVAALVLGLVRYRRRQISLSRDEAKPIDRSGGYTASSGITFTQSTETREPVIPPVRPDPPAAPAAPPAERLDTSGLPAVGDDATVPRDAPKRSIADVQLPEPPVAAPPEPPEPAEPAEPAAPEIEPIAPTDGRLERLRGRLAKSQNTLGRSMLGLLG
ncbi:MAG TPA: signal recognition particle-docking protein FtsY, partial [Mycobacterium sp.]